MKESKPPKVFIGVPCFGGMVCQEFLQSTLLTLSNCLFNKIALQIFTIGNESLITRARNQLVAEFMASDCSHLMFIDSDLRFDGDAVARLLSHNKPIVIGAYPLKIEPITYFIEPVENDEEIRKIGNIWDGLIEVTKGGTGFMLIQRGVIKDMQSHYPELHYTGDYDNSSYRQDLNGKDDHKQKLKENLYSLFDTSHDKENNNNYLSEDYTFCKRWRDMGGKIWLDEGIKLDHIGRKVFKGDVSKIF